ncbi:MAG TPA: ABC transporter substrate-binding protein [Terriglobales bacterium]|jgi:branched-chain amino acid transport system substrate-binding protein|nr:ABC transporter substrate-binding protein [Terriglobales bacterium]
MPHLRAYICAFTFAVLFAAAAIQLSAQESNPGVTSSTIRIGSCSALTGPTSFLGIQTQLGALAHFHQVNDAGGVNGRKIEIVSHDDGYDPENAPACFNSLLKEDVFAMGFFVGTPTAVKYIPLAESAKIPVVGLFTGAQILYEPLKHNIINVRSSYFDETREQVEGLWRSRGSAKSELFIKMTRSGRPCSKGSNTPLPSTTPLRHR